MEEGGAEILLMYIQNPKSLPPLNSVFTFITEALQLHYINRIICIWCGTNITNINTISLETVVISNVYLTLFCLEVPYVKRMTIVWICGFARESGYETRELEVKGLGYELLSDFCNAGDGLLVLYEQGIPLRSTELWNTKSKIRWPDCVLCIGQDRNTYILSRKKNVGKDSRHFLHVQGKIY